MITFIREELVEEKSYNKVLEFLQLKNINCTYSNIKEGIKNACIDKLCAVLGIRCKCNYKSLFFDAYSSIMGEAICRILKIPIIIAEDKYRFFKYDHINLIDYATKVLNSLDINEAFIELFKFLDSHKYILDYK